MKLIERIATWVGVDVTGTNKPEVVQLREQLEQGRQHKRAEAYAQAEACFAQAEALATSLGDRAILTIVTLHRADLHILGRQYDAAEALLRPLEAETRAAGEKAQNAYTRIALGTLAQARQSWAVARSDYEAALETAREAKAQGAEGRALGHLADTYLHEENLSYAVHLLREAMPRLSASGDVELSSYFHGRLGQALLRTNHEAEGEQLLGRALRLAENMQYRRFERMWHSALGRRAAETGRDSEAYRHFAQALERISEPVATDGLVTEALETLREIARTCLDLGRVDEALKYAERALALAPDDPAAQGVMGMVLRGAGRSADALSYLLMAATPADDAVAATGADIDPGILRSLAAVQAETGDVDGALATFQRALASAQERNDRLDEARVLRDLGAFYAGQNQPHNALKTWSSALQIYEARDYHAQVARLYCDIAGLRSFMGQNQRAIKDYEQALMHLNSIDDPETRGVVLSNAATAYVEQGDIETAESFFSESIKIAQKLGDRMAEATRRGNYGWFLLVTGRTQRALSALDYAIKQSEMLASPLHLAVQTSNLGLVRAEMGDVDAALRLHEDALTQVSALSPTFHNRYWTAVIRCNLANQLLATLPGAPDARSQVLSEAAAHFDAALAVARAIENNEGIIRGLTGLGRVALLRDDAAQAGALLDEAVGLARRTLSRRALAEALMASADVQQRRGEAGRAAATWEEARRIFEVLHHPSAGRPPAWLSPPSAPQG